MKVTQEQIAAWKEKYPICYELTNEDESLKGYIFDPSCNLAVIKMVADAALRGSQSTMVDAILNNCWLGGDEALRTDPRYKQGIDELVVDLIEMPSFTITRAADHALVTLPGYAEPVKLRLATRKDIAWAERRNKDQVPFDTAIYLLGRIADDPAVIARIKGDPRAYMALLLATKEVKEKKFVASSRL